MFRFPWTNFHELNLDWILQAVKKAQDIFTDGEERIQYAVDTADEAKEIATQAAEAQIADNAVSTRKIQDGAVTAAKLDDNSVTTPKIVDGAVTEDKLDDNSVTTLKIVDGAVTEDKLDAGIKEKFDYLKRNNMYNAAHVGAITDYNTQGCFTRGNVLYIYNYIDHSFTTLDFANNGYSYNTIVKNFWHGNDFTIIGDVVYCAPYSDDGGTPTKVLIRYDFITDTLSQLTPFADLGNMALFGIDHLDDNTLICALRPAGSDAVASTVFYTLNIATQEYTQLSINWNDIYTGSNSFPHTILYKDGILYLSGSFENGLYSFEISGNTAKCIGYRSLPYATQLGGNIAELEGLFTLPAYPMYIFGLSSSAANSALIIAINPDGDTPYNFSSGTYIPSSGVITIYVNATYTGIYEDGSIARPFKTMERAIAFANVCATLGAIPTLNLQSDITGSGQINIYTANMGLYGNGHTITKDVYISRGSVAVNSCIFNGIFETGANAFVRIQGNTVFNGALKVHEAFLFEEFKTTHNGRVTVRNAVWIASVDPAEDVQGDCTFQCIIQMNRTAKPANFSIGGGTTFLTSGVK